MESRDGGSRQTGEEPELAIASGMETGGLGHGETLPGVAGPVKRESRRGWHRAVVRIYPFRARARGVEAQEHPVRIYPQKP